MIGLLQMLGLASGRCLSCKKPFTGRTQGLICQECLDLLEPYHPVDYSERIEYVFSYRIFGLYEGVLRDVLQTIKFENSKGLALLLGEKIRSHLWEYLQELQPDIITCPSINLRRLWMRGFNHMEYILMGAGLSCMKLFSRRDMSPPLARLKREERQRAVMGHQLRGEFVDFVEGKRVLVVDDLLTTGSTIKRLAYLLLSAGANEVHAYFIAKAGQ